MSRNTKIALLLVFTCVTLTVTTGFAIGYAVTKRVAGEGMMYVKVHDLNEGVSFKLPIPIGLMTLGDGSRHFGKIRLASGDIDVDMEKWAPAIEAAAEAMENSPDARLVEILDDNERVTIDKKGTDLVIRVEADDANVEVTIPVTIVRKTIR